MRGPAHRNLLMRDLLPRLNQNLLGEEQTATHSFPDLPSKDLVGDERT